MDLNELIADAAVGVDAVISDSYDMEQSRWICRTAYSNPYVEVAFTNLDGGINTCTYVPELGWALQ
jgi:hypothetical protein